MHPYFLYQKLSKISVGLFVLSTLSFMILPMKLISFVLIFVFLILFIVFWSKSLSFNKEEEKIVKKQLDERNFDLSNSAIAVGVLLFFLLLIMTLKSKSWGWNLLIPFFLGVITITAGLIMKKKLNKPSEK